MALFMLLLVSTVTGQETYHKNHPSVSGSEVELQRYMTPPQNFAGNLAYDAEGERLWLISFGPPANSIPSTLYELDINSGEVVRSVVMPFKGEFGPPAYIDGFLYQCVFHESKLYEIDVNASNFGKVVRAIPLPSLLDLRIKSDSEVFRFPFISFHGATATPDKNILLYADELYEFVTVDRKTGRIRKRVKTVPALEGIATVPAPRGEFLVLAKSDPVTAKVKADLRRFLFRGAHTTHAEHKPTAQGVSWVLLNALNGKIVRSVPATELRPYVATIPSAAETKELPRSVFLPFKPTSVAIVRHESVAGSPFGRFLFLTTAEEGIWQLGWTPQ